MTTARSFKRRIDELAHGTNETAMRRDSGRLRGDARQPPFQRGKAGVPGTAPGGPHCFPADARVARQLEREMVAELSLTGLSSGDSCGR
jgi:hypothetical protein